MGQRRWIATASTTVALLVAGACTGDEPTGVGPSPTGSPTGDPTPASFDGTVSGWRIASRAVIEQEGLGRDLQLDCAPHEAPAARATDLDFTLTSLPSGAGPSLHPPAVVKWVCGDRGLSVGHDYDFDGGASLRVERALWDKLAYPIDAPAGRVEACTIGGVRAVCAHPEDDATGRGSSTILLIEDDTLDPFATILVLNGFGIPFDEMIKAARSID